MAGEPEYRVGNKLRELRTSRGEKIMHVADRADLDYDRLQRMEMRDDNLNHWLKDLHKAAKALGISLSSLIEGSRVA